MVTRPDENVQSAPETTSAEGSKGRKPRVVVVMPAYNAARTLEKTHGDLPKDIVDKVILVDDASQDNTASIARQLGLDVIVHVQNKGYGGNQKTCYIEALNQGADIVVMLHPDNQYDATRIPSMIAPIVEGKADLVLGSRLLDGRSATLQGGMPLWKYVSNRFLTTVENFALGTKLSEAHTGFRAYSRRLLTTIPFLLNSDDFVFDSEVIAQTVAFGFKIAEVPVPTRYFPEASSVNFRRSVIYGLATLNVSRKVWLHRKGLRKYPIFRKRLSSVLSREHKDRIFGAEGLAGNTEAGKRS
ncbi:MAG: glycosyltransferase family 2 protein [Chloroflexota bacterium]|nr:glycosyltransferase family 2 protein [Chloroflexota bacterium]MDQ5864333.1 glycosyltransferase family 2 protein [Chloroflexota bacterium]